MNLGSSWSRLQRQKHVDWIAESRSVTIQEIAQDRPEEEPEIERLTPARPTRKVAVLPVTDLERRREAVRDCDLLPRRNSVEATDVSTRWMATPARMIMCLVCAYTPYASQPEAASLTGEAAIPVTKAWR